MASLEVVPTNKSKKNIPIVVQQVTEGYCRENMREIDPIFARELTADIEILIMVLIGLLVSKEPGTWQSTFGIQNPMWNWLEMIWNCCRHILGTCFPLKFDWKCMKTTDETCSENLSGNVFSVISHWIETLPGTFPEHISLQNPDLIFFANFHIYRQRTFAGMSVRTPSKQHRDICAHNVPVHELMEEVYLLTPGMGTMKLCIV